MNFSQALEAMGDGKRVRRGCWPKGDYLDAYKLMNERRKDACLDDLFASDWQIVQPEPDKSA